VPEFEEKLVFVVGESVDVPLDGGDFVVDDASSVSEADDVESDSIVFEDDLPLFGVHLDEEVFFEEYLFASLMEVISELLFLLELPVVRLGGLVEVAFDGVESERVLFVDVKLGLECSLDESEVLLEMFVCSENQVGVVPYLSVLRLCSAHPGGCTVDSVHQLLVLVVDKRDVFNDVS